MRENIAGVQKGGRELGFVGSVGEELGFEAEAFPRLVYMPLFARSAFAKVVGCVELDAGHGCQNLQTSPAGRVKDLGRFG